MRCFVPYLFAAFAVTYLCGAAATRAAAQNGDEAPAAPPIAATAPVGVPTISIGRSALRASARKPFRDPGDNAVCVSPQDFAALLGATFTADEKTGKAYFINNETGATVTATLRTPLQDGATKNAPSDGVFVSLVEVAEGLGGKCEYDTKTNTLYVRSVITSVEMLGSQLRVKGTLPLFPAIRRIDGGKMLAFDFASAEIGAIPKTLPNLGAGIASARAGQFDDNTARIVLEPSERRRFVWLQGAAPSTLAVLSSAPGAAPPAGVSAPPVAATAAPAPKPAIAITMGADGKPLPGAVGTAGTVLPATPLAAPTVLRGVRFVRISDTQARIIVDAPNAPAVRTLLTKTRLTLDIGNAIFGPQTAATVPDASHPLLSGVQTVNISATTAQLLIDLSRAVNYTVRLDPKAGFIVDITLPKGAGGLIAGKLIVVDPGHGGHDFGAPGADGSHEKDVNLAIARALTAELRDRGANVILTRDSDSFVTLAERSEISNRAGADLFVSVHADSASPNADGSTVYYHLSDPSERTLATCIADRLHDMGGIRTRGSRSDGAEYTSGFSVLRHTKTLAILCENGYVSNSHDVALLRKEGMQAKIARCIASGIQDYIEGNPKSAGATPAPDSTPSVAAKDGGDAATDKK